MRRAARSRDEHDYVAVALDGPVCGIECHYRDAEKAMRHALAHARDVGARVVVMRDGTIWQRIDADGEIETMIDAARMYQSALMMER